MANALTIKPSEVRKPPPDKEKNNLTHWLIFILGDIALAFATWYIGGFAVGIAQALGTTAEAVRIGLQTTRILTELGWNLGMDKDYLTKMDGSINWNIIFLDTIFVLGFEGAPQIKSDIKWLKQINKLDREMIQRNVPFEMRQIIKQYAKDFDFTQQLKNVDEVAKATFNADKRMILESGASTFTEFKKVSNLLTKYKNKNIQKQIKELFGEKFVQGIKKTAFEKQVRAINTSIKKWNKQLDYEIEKRILFQSFKYTPKYVRQKLFSSFYSNEIKYIGWEEVKGISKLNYGMSVFYKWLALGRYLNPFYTSRHLAMGLWKGITTGVKKYNKKILELTGEKSAIKKLEDKFFKNQANITGVIKGKKQLTSKPVLNYTNRNAITQTRRKTIDEIGDLLIRKEKLLIKAFNIIPVASSWILGYRIITVKGFGFALHIFFRPSETACETNDWKGKPPIITHPMSMEEITMWANASSKGRYYLDNFAYGFDWHKYGLVLNVLGTVAPYKIQNTMWNIIRSKRAIKTTSDAIANLNQWTNLEWDRLIVKEFVPVFASKVFVSARIGSYVNPFVRGVIKGKGFWDMVHELSGRRTAITVKRFRRAHHSGSMTNVKKQVQHKQKIRRFIF